MGVPAFYRWLVDKYPKILVDAMEETPAGGGAVAVDTNALNPNGMEFDNLYLDMNGIIHPCFHPDDYDPHANLPATFDDVFTSVLKYVDRIFEIVRPRKLLFMAFDGVAPMAKLNQQRARVLLRVKTKEIKEEEEQRLRLKYMSLGKKVLPKSVRQQVDDWNVIAPGTEFMFEMSKVVQGYIRNRISKNPAWRDIKVILADANVPGEGEHKIISFIRSQRTQSGYNPNTRHCLYGMDADLIMLALATHELHFTILREKDKGSCYSNYPVKNSCTYQFLHVWILREYLELDLQLSVVPDGVKYDLERVIDDFIFYSFFVGNDFLPHMPTLDMNEGAMDLLITVYKNEFKNFGGHLVDTQRVNELHAAYINLERVERFVLSVGSYEDQIFEKRKRMKERLMRRKLPEVSYSLAEANICATVASVGSIPFPAVHLGTQLDDDIMQNTKALKEDLKRIVKERSDMYRNGSLCIDKVEFGSLGWKQRYYKEKFFAHNPQEVESIRTAVAKEYAEGLCWVLLYYFSGVPSWTWFYPYHYGPIASDLKGLSQVTVKFQMGSPFTPFDQLMAVLPPKSAHVLPRAYRSLMTDPCSELQSLYPKEVDIDMDGKRFLWQGVCLLPFIDGKLLLSATRKVAEKIEDYEAERNAAKVEKVFVETSSKFGSQIQSLLLAQATGDPTQRLPSFSIRCVNYKLPKLRKTIHRPLAGVKFPERCVSRSDIADRLLWHEHNYHLSVSRVLSEDGHLKYVSSLGHVLSNPFGRGYSNPPPTYGNRRAW